MRRKTNYQTPFLQVNLFQTRDILTESSDQSKNEDDDGHWSGVHNP